MNMEQPEYDDEANSTSPGPDSKRRKLRKGTRSCWDCKRRKVKCTFKSTTDTVCISCRRRGVACVSQEHPEEESYAEDNRGQLFDRVVRVETLLEDLIGKVDHFVERDENSVGLGLSERLKPTVYTPFSDIPSTESFVLAQRPCQGPKESAVCEPQLPTPDSSSDISPGIPVPEANECTKLSQELLEAFPSQEDIDILCKSDYEATLFFHQVITKEENGLGPEALDFVNQLAKIPDPSTHPVLVAKRMLILASFLQCFPPQQVVGLVEQPEVVRKRLTDTAIRLVTTNEGMTGCMEGLECIILEGIFQTNAGNLRRGWLAFRRAVVTAQLMRMDRDNPPPVKTLCPNTRTNPIFMWFRLVYMDRFLSLMLGLPQGCPNLKLDHEFPGETSLCKLERAHTVIAGRIVERNRQDPLFQDLAMTQELDLQLLNVAKSLPDKFWLSPNFASLRKHSRDAFWETMRCADQVHHYNLVHLLHLPYLLRSDQESYHTYSKTTCVNASREILNRFTAFRNFNTLTTCCRIADFFALMAGMTVLLAHIDSHRQRTANLLAHQRLSDRAMVEQVIMNMNHMAKENRDLLTRRTSDLLRCLMEVESKAEEQEVYNAHNALSCLEQECNVLQLPIPYFGIIKIGREGISKDWSTQHTSQPLGFDESPDSVHVANHIFSFGSGSILHQNPEATPLLTIPDGHTVQSQMEAQLAIPPGDDSVQQQQSLHPSLTAGVNDWAFQGVDTAFFDSLMRGS